MNENKDIIINGKVYKKKEKFIEALADFNPNVLPINYRPLSEHRSPYEA